MLPCQQMRCRALTKLLRWLLLPLLALTGLFLLPAVAYRAGKAVIGPYGGKLGLADYLGSIYRGAAGGEPLALWLLASPLLVALVWWLVLALGRRWTRIGTN